MSAALFRSRGGGWSGAGSGDGNCTLIGRRTGNRVDEAGGERILDFVCFEIDALAIELAECPSREQHKPRCDSDIDDAVVGSLPALFAHKCQRSHGQDASAGGNREGSISIREEEGTGAAARLLRALKLEQLLLQSLLLAGANGGLAVCRRGGAEAIDAGIGRRQPWKLLPLFLISRERRAYLPLIAKLLCLGKGDAIEDT